MLTEAQLTEIFLRIAINDPTLQELFLTGGNLPQDKILRFAIALQTNTHLRTLAIQENNLSPQAVTTILTSLRNHQNIISLFIGRNNFDASALQALRDFLINCRSINALNLEGSKFSDEAAFYLGDALKVNQSLQRLSLGSNNITGNAMMILAEALGKNRTLLELQLENNQIDETAMQYLASALNSSGIKSLSFCDNLNANAVRHLATALENDIRLEKLVFSNCNINQAGFGYLSNALRNNSNLRELEIHHNPTSRPTLIRIFNALASNKGLVKVRFALNDLDEMGAFYLSRAFLENSSIRDLTVAGGNLGYLGSLFLSQMLELNKGLVSVTLFNNNIPQNSVQLLKSAVAENPRLIKFDYVGLGPNVSQEFQELAQANKNAICQTIAQVEYAVFNRLFLSKELLTSILSGMTAITHHLVNNNRNDLIRDFFVNINLPIFLDKRIPLNQNHPAAIDPAQDVRMYDQKYVENLIKRRKSEMEACESLELLVQKFDEGKIPSNWNLVNSKVLSEAVASYLLKEIDPENMILKHNFLLRNGISGHRDYTQIDSRLRSILEQNLLGFHPRAAVPLQHDSQRNDQNFR